MNLLHGVNLSAFISANEEVNKPYFIIEICYIL